MNNGKYVFAQLLSFLPQRVFDKFVAEYSGNKYVRHFKGQTRAINDDIDGKKSERKQGEADVRLFMRCEKGLEVRNRRIEKVV